MSEPVADCGRNAARQGVVRPTRRKSNVTGLRQWPYNPPRGTPMNDAPRSSRRQLLRMSAVLGGGLLAERQKVLAWDTPGKLGAPLGPYGERSPFEKAVRWHRDSRTPETGSCFTPLQ